MWKWANIVVVVAIAALLNCRLLSAAHPTHMLELNVLHIAASGVVPYAFNRKQKDFNKFHAASSSWMMLRMEESALW